MNPVSTSSTPQFENGKRTQVTNETPALAEATFVEREGVVRNRGLGEVLDAARAIGLAPVAWNEQDTSLSVSVPLRHGTKEVAQNLDVPLGISVHFRQVDLDGDTHHIAVLSRPIPPLPTSTYGELFSDYALSLGLKDSGDPLVVAAKKMFSLELPVDKNLHSGSASLVRALSRTKC